MKNKFTLTNSILYVSLLGFLFMTSCTHYYYAPNEGTSLALTEKHDAKVSYGVGAGGNNRNHKSFQIGYSPINHIGIQASYFSGDAEGVQDGITERGDGQISNIALGTYYFYPTNSKIYKIEKRETLLGMKRGFLFDLYVGRGTGNVNNFYAPPASSHFDFNKTWGQGGIHWQGRFVGIDMVFKVGVLDFKNVEINGRLEESTLIDIENVIEYDTYNFRESTIKIHFGIRHLRYFITTTWLNTSNASDVKFIDNVTHIGVMIDIDEFFKKRKKTIKTD